MVLADFTCEGTLGLGMEHKQVNGYSKPNRRRHFNALRSCAIAIHPLLSLLPRNLASPPPPLLAQRTTRHERQQRYLSAFNPPLRLASLPPSIVVGTQRWASTSVSRNTFALLASVSQRTTTTTPPQVTNRSGKGAARRESNACAVGGTTAAC